MEGRQGGREGGRKEGPLLWNVFNSLVAALKKIQGNWKQARIIKSSFSKHKTELEIYIEVIYKFTKGYQKACVLKKKFMTSERILKVILRYLCPTVQSEQPSRNLFFKNPPTLHYHKKHRFQMPLFYQIMVGKPNGPLQKASVLERR